LARRTTGSDATLEVRCWAVIQEGILKRIVKTQEQLDFTLRDSGLDAKAVGKLNIIFLYAPNCDCLSLVLGGDETVVGFDCGHGEPPYYASSGYWN